MRSKADCGRLGGRATVQRHGVEHMREIGRRGAQSFHRRYRLAPVGVAYFAIIERATGFVRGYTPDLPVRHEG